MRRAAIEREHGSVAPDVRPPLLELRLGRQQELRDDHGTGGVRRVERDPEIVRVGDRAVAEDERAGAGREHPCRALVTASFWLFDMEKSISPFANRRWRSATSDG
jgi:hypothetical protein